MQLNLNMTGEDLRDIGMKRAEDHANAVIPEWSVQARHFLEMYLKAFPGPFMAFSFREWAKDAGLPEPPNKKAFGAVIKSAASDGLITKVGYGQTGDPKSHSANVSIWRAAA